MDANEFRQKLIDELKRTWSKQDNEDVVRLTPEQARKKCYEVTELIEKTSKKYNLYRDIDKLKELDEKIATIFKKYPEILTIQNKCRENLGMIATQYKLEQSVLVALDNETASLQQDKWGYNIGMSAVCYGLERAVLKALDNKEASLQQNALGYNIGMLATIKRIQKAASKSMENKEACKQKNIDGDTIESLYQEKFGKALAY